MTDSRSWKTWRFSFLSVAMKLWLRLELSVPLSARNPPLIGCFTLPGLMSLSAWLFVNGTSSALAKRPTAAGCFFDLSHKFRPFVRFSPMINLPARSITRPSLAPVRQLGPGLKPCQETFHNGFCHLDRFFSGGGMQLLPSAVQAIQRLVCAQLFLLHPSTSAHRRRNFRAHKLPPPPARSLFAMSSPSVLFLRRAPASFSARQLSV